MENTSEYVMVVSTCGDKESAKRLAGLLVEARLAACVKLLPVESTYSWKGEVCCENETMMLIKSTSALFDELAAFIRDNHSYEVPEVIQLPITCGIPEYLHWIKSNVK